MATETYPLAVPEDLLDEVRGVAARTHLSMADALRESIRLGLPRLAERSRAELGEKGAAVSQIHALASECSKPGWNGQDSRPVGIAAIATAEAVVRALPDGVPLPKIAPEPDGSISLDWMQSKDRLFSLSAGSNNRLAFDWVDGTDKGHGVAAFDRINIPPRILENIRGIMEGSQ